MRDKRDLDVGDAVPEPIVTELTTVHERLAGWFEEDETLPSLFARLGSSSDDDGDDDDEPPPLPPVPARGSQQYEVPRVHVLQRALVPRMRPVPRRADSHTPPIELDAEYEALLRQLR